MDLDLDLAARAAAALERAAAFGITHESTAEQIDRALKGLNHAVPSCPDSDYPEGAAPEGPRL